MPDQQWQVDSITPTPTPPSQQGADQWQVDSVTPTPTQQQPPQPPQQAYVPFPEQARRDWERVKGAVKGAARTGAGLVDLADAPLPIPGNQGSQQPYAVSSIRHLTDAIRARTQMSNPEQEQGDFVESALEILPLIEEEGPGMVKNLVEKMGVGQDLAKFAQKFPKLAAAWNVMAAGSQTAARATAEQGGQTYIKTGGDMPATIKAAKNAFIWGAGLGTGTATLGQASKVIREGIEGARPGSRTIARADFETNPKTGKAVLRNLEDVAQDPATQAVDEALGHIAKTGVANSINRTNAERPAGMPQETRKARMLPAPEGSAQGFRVGTTPPEEVGEPPRTSTVTEQTGTRTVPNPDYEAPAGELTRSPGQTAEQTGAEIGEGATTATPERSYEGPGDVDTRNATQQRIDAARGLVPRRMIVPPETVEQPVYQQTPVTTQPRIAVTVLPDRATEMQPNPQTMGGGGPMILTADGRATSVERARQELAQRTRILNDPDEVAQMGVREHQNMVDAHADLTDQLHRYDNFAASQPHFPAGNPLEAARNTDSLGDMSTQLKQLHGTVFQAADDASGGEFSNLRDEEDRLQKQIYGENPTGKLDDLRQQLKVNQQAQLDFFKKYRDTLSPQEYSTALGGYQDGIVTGNLDLMLQRKFGGISRELEQRGIASGNQRQRVFQPSKDFNQELEDFYNDGFRGSATNREVLERTIGQKHMDELHDLGLLFNSTERMEQTQGLIKTTLSSILHHYHGVKGMLASGAGAGILGLTLGVREAGLGAAIGGGVPLLTGTASGIDKYISNKLITDPSFLKSFSYALGKIPARTAGPLLAARIISQWENQGLKQQGQQQPQPEETK